MSNAVEIYSALLLHKAGKEINEANLKSVVEAAGVRVEDAKIKSLVANLEGVNIDDAIKQAAVLPVAASVPVVNDKKVAEKPKEEKKAVDDAASGLSSLFG